MIFTQNSCISLQSDWFACILCSLCAGRQKNCWCNQCSTAGCCCPSLMYFWRKEVWFLLIFRTGHFGTELIKNQMPWMDVPVCVGSTTICTWKCILDQLIFISFLTKIKTYTRNNVSVALVLSVLFVLLLLM